MLLQFGVVVAAVLCIRYAESDSKYLVKDTPLFSCNTINKHNTALKMEQMENTTIHEYLIDQILGMVAWDYKRHYSWVIQGQMHHSIMDLHYCVDENGIVGLNAQKYDYDVVRGGNDYIYFCIEFPVDCDKNYPTITVDGTAEKFGTKHYQVIDINTYHAFRFFPNYEWLKK